MKGIRSVAMAVVMFMAVSVQAGELRISVAKSMSDLFKELAADFTAANPGVTIIPNFGPSGGLAKQIDQGAPADLYVSANPKWMAFLVEKGRIAPGTEKTFAHNVLVFVGRDATGVATLADLAKLDRIGLGSPTSVPAGQYAKEALDNAGLWQRLLDGGQLVMAKDVRQALIYADRGETGGSFVYGTDARLATEAKVLFTVPQELYSRVTYPLAITAAATENPEARAFYDYVTSEAVHDKLRRYGFTLPE